MVSMAAENTRVFFSKELLDLQRFAHPIRSLSSSLMICQSWWIWGVFSCNACSTVWKRDAEGAFAFFSTTGFLPRPFACGLVDIHRVRKEQPLINSIRGRNRGVCAREGEAPSCHWCWERTTFKNFSQETCWSADKTNSSMNDHYSCNQRRKHWINLFITRDCGQWTQRPSEARNTWVLTCRCEVQALLQPAGGHSQQEPTSGGTAS